MLSVKSSLTSAQMRYLNANTHLAHDQSLSRADLAGAPTMSDTCAPSDAACIARVAWATPVAAVPVFKKLQFLAATECRREVIVPMLELDLQALA